MCIHYMMCMAVQVYDPGKVQHMLAALRAECDVMMLFLRTVEHLEVLEWRPGSAMPAVQFTCSLQGITPSLRAQRALFSEASRGPAQREVQGTHRLDFAVVDAGAAEERHSYLVSQLKGTGRRATELAAVASRTFGSRAIPWGCVAAKLPADPGENLLRQCTRFGFKALDAGMQFLSQSSKNAPHLQFHHLPVL